ncbi:hypothetical protein K7X08_023228 [Anisodus acutangulus]|uniref:Uncharacterized protein n=1 Tax=Anisodus acutangulus TaxID=402998 RepID=A0A9Q1LI17_9SOLA|nr:hypothetical protein K7X08_023228 [Anisodus acutangulus]
MELGNLPKLQMLGLTGNELTGSVPANIFNKSTLQVLTLSENKLSGTLPSDLGRGMPILEEFICGTNNLSCFISASISNSSRLRMLDLSGNGFTGPIPKSLGNLEHLELLNLHNNNFFSDSALSFLTSLTNCRKLRAQWFNKNALDGVFRYLLEFYLQSNKIEGTIPDVMCSLKNLGALDLSRNQFSGSAATLIDLSKNIFSGEIPSTLGDLGELIKLSLADNRLEGSIPESFGKLLALEFLDLCYNNLSGEIPKSLEALVYLKYLSISFNEFSGEIPTSSPFANVTSQSFLSNDALCGESRFNVTMPNKIYREVKKKNSAYKFIYCVRDWITTCVGSWICGVKIEKDKEECMSSRCVSGKRA